jgi:magnesium-protoporphyrin O-methyltransferase
MSCCCSYEAAANDQFHRKKVDQELKQYRLKGPGATTRLLADGVVASGTLGATVLDVGSGVGGLALALLERGATSAIAVDASSSYIEAAREEASRVGRSEAIRFVHADFVTAAREVPAASVVTLDRVLCCYPAYEMLLDAATSHAERCFALSYPRDTWYVRLAMALDNMKRRLAGNPFRAFVHPVSRIQDAIGRAGFTLSGRRETWWWSADVYVRR